MGKEQEKNSFSRHIKAFNSLIASFSMVDFDPSVSVVPVGGENNIILDGAHRVAALSFFGKDVTACFIGSVEGEPYDYSYYRERWISGFVEKLVAREMIGWLPGLRLLVVWSGAAPVVPDPGNVAYSCEVKVGRRVRRSLRPEEDARPPARSKVFLYILTGDCPLGDNPDCQLISGDEDVRRASDLLLLPRWYGSFLSPLFRLPGRLKGDILFYYARSLFDARALYWQVRYGIVDQMAKH